MRESLSRVQCLSGCREVDANFEAKIVLISRPSIARVPGRIWHLTLKIPGKIISPTFYLHNTGVRSKTEMQFRPWEPRCIQLETFCARLTPTSTSSPILSRARKGDPSGARARPARDLLRTRRPPRARNSPFETFCASPGARCTPLRPFAHAPRRPARAPRPRSRPFAQRGGPPPPRARDRPWAFSPVRGHSRSRGSHCS